MCKFKSGIILKDRVFVPDYDSHTDMLEALEIVDSRENAERLFVRAELIPKNRDVFSDIDEWSFVVDQDIIPEWFVAEYEKQRMIKAVKEWAKNRIFIDVNNLRLKDGKAFYLKNCKNVVCENSSVVAWGNSSVVARENSSVEAWGNSSVVARENSSVEARGNSSVVARGNSSVVARENSSVEAWGNSSVVARGNSVITKPRFSAFDTDRLILSENSTFKDCVTKTLYQSGDYKLVVVTDGKIK